MKTSKKNYVETKREAFRHILNPTKQLSRTNMQFSRKKIEKTHKRADTMQDSLNAPALCMIEEKSHQPHECMQKRMNNINSGSSSNNKNIACSHKKTHIYTHILLAIGST